ncbi:MAG: hypothetical protein IJS48_03530 [Prevotella sp.]|nr:hypothetical protein [Prevotella sp.]
MKKLFLLLLMAVAFCGSADAQKGMKGVGINMSSYLNSDGIGIGGGLKFQYNISDYFRLEPLITVVSYDSDTYFSSLLNLHSFLSSPKACRPYVLIGVGYGHHWTDGCVAGAGFGLDWRLSHQFSFQLEAGGNGVIGEESGLGLKIILGVTYNF